MSLMPQELAPVAERYRRFAVGEARGRSPVYERLALGVAGDRELVAWLGRLPPGKQQPNLLFAVVRYLGHQPGDYGAFREFVLERAGVVAGALMARRTQTNEVGRCALLLPVLARLRGPLALVEVGASAGLCLLVDRYAYDYGGRVAGDPAGPLVLGCEPRGPVPVPVPAAVPEVVWRRGIDLAPVDVTDPEGVRWLECCVWPDQPRRLDRLRRAVRVAREDPPVVVRGDLLEQLEPVVAQAPAGATVVVFHAGVLCYLPVEGRRRFAGLMARLPVVWISAEGPGAVPSLEDRLPLQSAERLGGAVYLLGQGADRLMALGDPHGAWLRWVDTGRGV